MNCRFKYRQAEDFVYIEGNFERTKTKQISGIRLEIVADVSSPCRQASIIIS